MKLDPVGNVYAAGTFKPTSDYDGVNSEVFALKISPDGAILWKSFPGSSGRDEALEVGSGPTGDVFLVSQGRLSQDSWRFRFRRFAGDTGAMINAYEVDGGAGKATVDEEGSGFVARGAGTLSKFSAANGRLLWEMPATPGDVRGLSSLQGSVIVERGAGDNNVRFSKFSSATGSLIWEVTLAEAYGGSPVTMDPAGNFIVQTYGFAKRRVLKIDGANGSILWSSELPDPIYALAVTTVDQSGDFYVASSTSTPSGAGNNVITYKMAGATGEIVWRYSFGALPKQELGARAISVDSQGSVAISISSRKDYGSGTGASSPFLILHAISSVDGARTWSFEGSIEDWDGSMEGQQVASGIGAIWVSGTDSPAFWQMRLMKFHNGVAAPPPSYQALWWASPAGSESGWGLNVVHQGEKIFATWFTYDSGGAPIWMVASDLKLQADGSYSGSLYRTSGPSWESATFDPSAVTVQAVGSATLRFSGPDAGVFEWSVNGVSRRKPITRQLFLRAPDCAVGGSSPTTGNYDGLWWRAPAGSEAGWGLNVSQQYTAVFATWFTYGADGKPTWFVLPTSDSRAPNKFEGALYRTTGPAFDSASWDRSKVSATYAGYATIEFSSVDSGIFTYTVDNKSASKPITRQSFATPPSICH